MKFLAALQFLTIIPLPRRGGSGKKEFGGSLSYFPLVGLGLGAILVCLNHVLSPTLPLSVVSALLIMVLAILTGANHLDGFIDTCDGVFCSKSIKERLVIMSDTQIGTFGVVSVFLLLLTKYASLSAISEPALRLPALLLMPTLSRWAVAWAILAFPSAKTSGMGASFKQEARWQEVVAATVIALTVSVLLLEWWGIVVMAALGFLVFVVGSFLRFRLGGLTGDNYGAINELSEVIALILLLLFSRRF